MPTSIQHTETRSSTQECSENRPLPWGKRLQLWCCTPLRHLGKCDNHASHCHRTDRPEDFITVPADMLGMSRLLRTANHPVGGCVSKSYQYGLILLDESTHIDFEAAVCIPQFVCTGLNCMSKSVNVCEHKRQANAR